MEKVFSFTILVILFSSVVSGKIDAYTFDSNSGLHLKKEISKLLPNKLNHQSLRNMLNGEKPLQQDFPVFPN